MDVCQWFTLVFEASPETLEHRITDFCGLVNNMEVLSTGFTDNPRVTSVFIEIRSDILPKLPEYKGASGEVQRCKIGISDGLCHDFGRRPRHKLDDTRRDTGLRENLVNKVIRIGGCRRGLPNHNVPDQRGG